MALVAPGILVPFKRHWYEGMDPPLVILVVNVTEEPAQIVVPTAELMTMVGVTSGVMLMAMVLLVAVVVDKQVALEVNTQEI